MKKPQKLQHPDKFFVKTAQLQVTKPEKPAPELQ